jgi:hypothetical protein
MKLGKVLCLILVAAAVASNAEAAVRRCGQSVTSGPQQASSVALGQKRAIAAWAKAAGIANGERFTNWRLAFTKSLSCRPATSSGVICEARGAPCVIEQVPSNALPPALKVPEPKVIPVLPRPAGSKAIDA